MYVYPERKQGACCAMDAYFAAGEPRSATDVVSSCTHTVYPCSPCICRHIMSSVVGTKERK